MRGHEDAGLNSLQLDTVRDWIMALMGGGLLLVAGPSGESDPRGKGLEADEPVPNWLRRMGGETVRRTRVTLLESW